MQHPVEDFMETLDRDAQARIAAAIEKLRVRNVHAGEPLVKHIDGKIWELRQATRSGAFRVLYFMFVGRQIVLLHAFQKKTRQTPRREVTIAQARMERIRASLEGQRR